MRPPNASPEPNASADNDNGLGMDDQAAAAVFGDLEALKGRMQTAEKERDQYLELLQRTRADFENYQKRIQRDIQQERRYSAGPVALDLLPVIDNLERAMEAAKKAGEAGPLVQGVAMVQNQVVDSLKRHGITLIDALNKPFDPTQHQAVMQQPGKDQPPNTVIQVLQQGFMIHDRVLRPASVIVSA
jgi:molecular chaperone GrpE